MLFLIVGVLLLLLKMFDLGPFGDLSWVVVLAPFGLAVAWWAFADGSGLTQRRAIQKMEKRKRDRRERDMKALGLDVRRDQRVRVMRETRRPSAPPPASPPPAPPASRRDPRL